MDIFYRLPSLKKLLIEKANLGVCTSATSLPLYSCIISLSRLYGCYFKKNYYAFLRSITDSGCWDFTCGCWRSGRPSQWHVALVRGIRDDGQFLNSCIGIFIDIYISFQTPWKMFCDKIPEHPEKYVVWRSPSNHRTIVSLQKLIKVSTCLLF